MNKKTGFILYFDILGYKSIVNDSSKENEKRLQYLLNYYSETLAKLNFSLMFGDRLKNKSKLFMRCFSDNFLFVYESRPLVDCDSIAKKRSFATDFDCIKGVGSLIQQQFLEQGILTRGSISFGTIEFNNQIVYGKSLIKAVELEEGHSEPSIIIDTNLCKSIKGEIDYIHPFLYKNDDSSTHLIILGGLSKCISALSFDNCTGEQKDNILKKIEWMVEEINNYFDYAEMQKYKLDRKTLKLTKK